MWGLGGEKGQHLFKVLEAHNYASRESVFTIYVSAEGGYEGSYHIGIKPNKFGCGGNHQIYAQVLTARVTTRYRRQIAPSPKSTSTIFPADIHQLLGDEKG